MIEKVPEKMTLTRSDVFLFGDIILGKRNKRTEKKKKKNYFWKFWELWTEWKQIAFGVDFIDPLPIVLKSMLNAFKMIII